MYLTASHPISITPTSLIRIFYTVDPFHRGGGYKWFASFCIFQLEASHAKTVRPFRVVVQMLEAIGQKRAGILRPESCNPGSGIALPGRDGRLGSLKGLTGA